VSRADAAKIWWAGVHAVQPGPLLTRAFQELTDSQRDDLRRAPRVVVVGAGKAGAGMALACEAQLRALGPRPEIDFQNWVLGEILVPEDPQLAGWQAELVGLKLIGTRPAGSNRPTEAGVAASQALRQRLWNMSPDDIGLGLFSGGGSALMPEPAAGLTLADKLIVTDQLSRAGAAIEELNIVRKQLSAIKGGRLAAAFRGRWLLSWILSDIIGDPLDLIAGGPTVPDASTPAQAHAILTNYDLWRTLPEAIRRRLERHDDENPRRLPASIQNRLIGSNDLARQAAGQAAQTLGYRVIDCGGTIAGETEAAAQEQIRRILADSGPRPACWMSGGETTTRLGPHPGRGGRNQEFALATWLAAPRELRKRLTVLCGGTDGEDGPTDAAGGIFPAGHTESPSDDSLARQALTEHDVYPYLRERDALWSTGPTGTNVMDLRIFLVQDAAGKNC